MVQRKPTALRVKEMSSRDWHARLHENLKLTQQWPQSMEYGHPQSMNPALDRALTAADSDIHVHLTVRRWAMTRLTTVDLLALVREAVALQPGCDDVLLSLVTGTGPVAPSARTASRLAGRYWELLQLLPPPDTDLIRRIGCLLDYHEQLLRQTMRFACSLDHRGPRRARLRHQQASGGLGAPGQELRRILADLELSYQAA